jgi:hypothetical protein
MIKVKLSQDDYLKLINRLVDTNARDYHTIHRLMRNKCMMLSYEYRQLYEPNIVRVNDTSNHRISGNDAQGFVNSKERFKQLRESKIVDSWHWNMLYYWLWNNVKTLLLTILNIVRLWKT